MFHRGWFWLDAGSMRFAHGIEDEARQYAVVRTGNLADATIEIAREPRAWAGVITHLDGRQYRQLELLRRHAPALPVLALLDQRKAALVDTFQARGIACAVLPDDGPRVTAFIQRAFAAAFLPNAHVAGLVQQMADRAGLTSREVQILAYCLANESRQLMCKRLGITENTLKTQVKGLLRKSHEPTMDALAKNILRTALLHDGPQARIAKAPPSLQVAC